MRRRVMVVVGAHRRAPLRVAMPFSVLVVPLAAWMILKNSRRRHWTVGGGQAPALRMKTPPFAQERTHAYGDSGHDPRVAAADGCPRQADRGPAADYRQRPVR